MCVLLAGWTVQAQSISEGTFPFIKKISSQAYGLSREYSATEDELKEELETIFRTTADVKVKEQKSNIIAAQSARLMDISPKAYDYYYRVEKAGDKTSEKVRLTFFISIGNYNFVTPDRYPEVITAARNWMESVEMRLKENERKIALANETKLLVTQKKALEDLAKEKLKLDEELKSLQAKIQQNEEAQAAQKEIINETEMRRKGLGAKEMPPKR